MLIAVMNVARKLDVSSVTEPIESISIIETAVFKQLP
jgi:hypothetical protein